MLDIVREECEEVKCLNNNLSISMFFMTFNSTLRMLWPSMNVEVFNNDFVYDVSVTYRSFNRPWHKNLTFLFLIAQTSNLDWLTKESPSKRIHSKSIDKRVLVVKRILSLQKN